ncbi:hypothetical protein D9K95_00545 [Klebsiella pneumoniae]|nr:hypothetical protein C2U49_03070 [Klebsiella pneumoniae]PNM32724.1 hypothetical protein AL478_007690 [Klebsiella pneumoniae]POW75417.1 hypothetical protein C3413_24735 [Klebsiella pneumoniae]RLL33138.1 hypothetical protein D9K95_00545 [Klebsiella pneumoniae]
MFANKFVGFFEQRLAIDWLGCTLHNGLLFFSARSLRRAASWGKFSMHKSGVMVTSGETAVYWRDLLLHANKVA